jgi:hypothetical protein
LTGGDGDDVFAYTNTAGALSSEGGADEAITDLGDSDVIQFATGALNLMDGGTAATDGTNDNLTEVASDGDIASNSDTVFFEITGEDLSSDEITQASNISTALDGLTVASDAEALFVLDDGTDSYLWHFDSGTGTTDASTVETGELTLVGKVEGNTDLDDEDFDISA